MEDLQGNAKEERWGHEWRTQTSANWWGALSQQWKEKRLEAAALRWATEQEVSEDQRDEAMAHYKRCAYNQAHDRSRRFVDVAQIERTWEPPQRGRLSGPLPPIDWTGTAPPDIACPCINLDECQRDCLVRVHGFSREQAFRVARQGGRIVDGVIQPDHDLMEQTAIISEAFRWLTGRFPTQNEFYANVKMLQTGALTLDDYQQRNERFQTAAAISHRLPYHTNHEQGTLPPAIAPRDFLGRVARDVVAGEMVEVDIIDEASRVPERVWRTERTRGEDGVFSNWARAQIVLPTEEETRNYERNQIRDAFRQATGSYPNSIELQKIIQLLDDDELDWEDVTSRSMHFMGMLPEVTVSNGQEEEAPALEG